ncbi:LodA/GoxA family CTQ-dependent oxidase [Comamonas sp. JC664]|uniref:LodA/GoxA family CTQ-dependent oxidase n=1 Tax=Comamonas sp. JC664 TaxID=2801917 RepID=UPI00174B3515|nr:LodA/GoxA family CTQ-dependent oxidase [Comamonas sp. JC664]MBL0697363.1 LodA/GoxA family CTQ-dependent oxidase [Comamonas sp. JC664]GHG67288.1 hypothetical protein GCM10012319_09510 [Comamonas sp. KCTC 72670]
MSTTYKIHPAIGVARVGDSEEYYLGPEEAGGLPQELGGGDVTVFRDGQQAMRRQAARFQIHAYDAPGANGRRVQPGEGGIKDIRWTVHLANKKAAWYEFQQQLGADGNYEPQGTPLKPHPLRNPIVQGDERGSLIIDPGPRSVACRGDQGLSTTADFGKNAPGGYATSFPPANLVPENSDITTLGQLIADGQGYLLTLGGYGKSGASTHYNLTSSLLSDWADNPDLLAAVDGSQDRLTQLLQALKAIADIGYDTEAQFDAAIDAVLADPASGLLQGEAPGVRKFITDNAYAQPRLDAYANNPFWWDDVSDGPVTATLVMDDGSEHEVDFPAWVFVGPPAYAPQILNIISLYDTLFDTFVRARNLRPDIYQGGAFNDAYTPNFQADILPILSRPAAYEWVSDIGPLGNGKHDAFQGGALPPRFIQHIRNPQDVNVFTPDLMPKMAGDNPLSDYRPRTFLSLTETQYFFLQQYSQGRVDHGPPPAPESDGARLDRAVLDNCVGGAFCPGIEVTWIARDANFFMEDPAAGIRFKHRPPSGHGLQWNTNPNDGKGLEPGDASKYMAQPWQADFNECANQPIQGNSLWWWPAQRPYYVNYLDENDQWQQGYWTRPEDSNFVKDEDMVFHWKRLGFILRRSDAPAVERGPESGPGMPPAPQFIEVERTYKPGAAQPPSTPKAGTP